MNIVQPRHGVWHVVADWSVADTAVSFTDFANRKESQIKWIAKHLDPNLPAELRQSLLASLGVGLGVPDGPLKITPPPLSLARPSAARPPRPLHQPDTHRGLR